MKKLFTLITFSILLLSTTSNAQNRSGLELAYVATDYFSSQYGEPTMFLYNSDDRWSVYNNGISLGYYKELTRWFDFSGHAAYSRVDLPGSASDSTFVDRLWYNYSSSMGYDGKSTYLKNLFEVDARLHLNILDKTKWIINPYLFAGISGAYTDKVGANAPVGLGAFVNFTKEISLNLSYAQRFALSKAPELDRNQINIGFVMWKNGKKKETEPVVVDTDGDGINDDIDKCPELAGEAKYGGCPDSDGDGIRDAEDKCPNQAGPASNAVCPVADTDGDGINDDNDDCPNEAGIARYDGCPIPDSDNDGFNDEVDKCPEVFSDINNGCPEIKQDVVEKIKKAAGQVHFQSSKSVLTVDSDENLDIIAGLLRDNPSYKCDIKGYTDSTGSVEFNKKLSNDRAKVCYDYLVNKGIDASRLTFEGFGPESPVATNKTKEGRAKNRRTEFVLRNY